MISQWQLIILSLWSESGWSIALCFFPTRGKEYTEPVLGDISNSPANAAAVCLKHIPVLLGLCWASSISPVYLLYGRKSLSRWSSMALRHNSVHSSKKRARQWILPSYYGYAGHREPANTDPVSHFNHTDSVADLQQIRGETQIWDVLMYWKCVLIILNSTSTSWRLNVYKQNWTELQRKTTKMESCVQIKGIQSNTYKGNKVKIQTNLAPMSVRPGRFISTQVMTGIKKCIA